MRIVDRQVVAIRKIDAFLLLSAHFEDLRTENGENCEWSDGRFRFYFSVKRASNTPHMGVEYCTVDGSTVQSTVDSCTFDGEEVFPLGSCIFFMHSPWGKHDGTEKSTVDISVRLEILKNFASVITYEVILQFNIVNFSRYERQTLAKRKWKCWKCWK